MSSFDGGLESFEDFPEVPVVEDYATDTIEARLYQTTAIERVRQMIAEGIRKIVIAAPTGSGKTEIAIKILSQASSKGSTAVFICDRRNLVIQTYKRMRGAGVRCGMVMAGKSTGRNENIQICSVQTLFTKPNPNPITGEREEMIPRFKELLENADIIVIDECHTIWGKLVKFLEGYKGIVLGLSATPFTPGMGDIYHGFVNVETTNNLLKAGWLCPVRCYSAEKANITKIDTSKLEINSMGEYTDESVDRQTSPIKGDAVENWIRLTQEHFGGPVQTLVFTKTVKAGEELAEQYAAAGYDFRVGSYKDSEKKSDRLLNMFENGEFIGLISVDKFVKGFDVPGVRCIQNLRPFRKAFKEWIQMLGRVMRPLIDGGKPMKNEDGTLVKGFGLLIDHTDNYMLFQLMMSSLFKRGIEKLYKKGERKKRMKTKNIPKPKECVECGLQMEKGEMTCPACGAEQPRPKSKVCVVPGVMKRVMDIDGNSLDMFNDPQWVWEQICIFANKRHPENHTKATKFAFAQYKQIYNQWPATDIWGNVSEFATGSCDPIVSQLIETNLRMWRKRQFAIRGRK